MADQTPTPTRPTDAPHFHAWTEPMGPYNAWGSFDVLDAIGVVAEDVYLSAEYIGQITPTDGDPGDYGTGAEASAACDAEYSRVRSWARALDRLVDGAPATTCEGETFTVDDIRREGFALTVATEPHDNRHGRGDVTHVVTVCRETECVRPILDGTY